MDKAHYCRVIRKLQIVVGSGPGTAVVGHKGEQQQTQDAALGEPVLREMTLKVLLPTCTDWGLSVRKSSSQLDWAVLKGGQFAHQMLRDDGVQKQHSHVLCSSLLDVVGSGGVWMRWHRLLSVLAGKQIGMGQMVGGVLRQCGPLPAS